MVQHTVDGLIHAELRRDALEPEYAESKVIVLDPEELAKGEVTVNVGKARELYEKYWEQLKAGD